jgi:threonine/homoserine/homoserine lactone efflux protein
MDIYQIISFLAASVLLTLLPGPDILFVVAQSISSGWRSGVAVAIGLCSGLIVHTSAVALGVAALLAAHPVALTGIKVLGAVYLLYLAYMAWGEKGLRVVQSEGKLGYAKLMKVGFVMNVLNPKVLLFYLAFLPQYVVPGTSTILQVFILGAVFFIQALAIFSVVAYFAGLLNRTVEQSAASRHIGKIKSAVFVLIAANLLWL